MLSEIKIGMYGCHEDIINGCVCGIKGQVVLRTN